MNTINDSIQTAITSLKTDKVALARAAPLSEALLRRTTEEYLMRKMLMFKKIKSYLDKKEKEDLETLRKENKTPVQLEFESQLDSYINKKMLQDLFDMNCDMKFANISHLFCISSQIMNDLRQSQIDLANSGLEHVFETSLYSRVRNYTKILAASCRTNKAWLDQYADRAKQPMEYVLERENAKRDFKEQASNYLGVNIDSPTSALNEDNGGLPGFEKKRFSADSYAYLNETPPEHVDSAPVSDPVVCSPTIKPANSKMIRHTTNEAEELLLLNMCLNTSSASETIRPPKLINFDETNK